MRLFERCQRGLGIIRRRSRSRSISPLKGMRVMTFLRFLLLLTTLCSTTAFSQNNVRLTSGEWSPHLSERLPRFGFASHVVSEAFSEVGVKVEYSFFPWGRALHNAGRVQGYDGEHWHGSVVWLKTPLREERFFYSEKVLTEPQVIFVLKNKNTDLPLEEYLKGLRVGVPSHTAYPALDTFEERGLIVIERLGDYEVLFKRLLVGRVDAVAVEKRVGGFYLDNSLTAFEKNKVTSLNSYLDERSFYLILNRKWSEAERYIRLFNQGLTVLKKDGRYAEYVRRLNEGYYNQ